MQTSKFLIALILAISVMISQVGAAFAAPTLQDGTIVGTVNGLTCRADPMTGIKTFLVALKLTDGTSQTVLIDQATAESLGLIEITADGSPDCTQEVLDTAIGMEISIAATDILEDEEPKHPVGDALATFFEEITDYDTIMQAHNGELEELEFGKFGFGVLAQALWLTTKLEGDSDTFLAILLAKKTNDYNDHFTYENGTSIPQNWGQFRKLILDGDKKASLGIVMSEKDQDNGNNSGNNGIGLGTGNGNGQGQNNGNNANKHNKNEKGNKGNSEDKGKRKNK